MKRIFLILVPVLLVLSTPGIAQAWTSIMERSGFRYVQGQTWVENHPRVRFYAGATESGETTYFRVGLRVRCQGGYSYVDSGRVHDYPFRYWTWIVRIPQAYNQGRCTLFIQVRALSPSNTDMTIGVEIP